MSTVISGQPISPPRSTSEYVQRLTSPPTCKNTAIVIVADQSPEAKKFVKNSFKTWGLEMAWITGGVGAASLAHLVSVKLFPKLEDKFPYAAAIVGGIGFAGAIRQAYLAMKNGHQYFKQSFKFINIKDATVSNTNNSNPFSQQIGQ